MADFVASQTTQLLAEIPTDSEVGVTPEQRFIDSVELEEILAISKSSIFRFIGTDELPPHVYIGGNLRWWLPKVVAWAESRPGAPKRKRTRKGPKAKGKEGQ